MYSSLLRSFVLLAAALFVSGCNPQARDFALPKGNVEQGEVAYAELKCNSCHSRTNKPSLKVEGLDIPLGGTVTKVDSYAGLVTSIINPSHRVKWEHKGVGKLPDGTSAMKNYNDIMTVQQLVDLVTMLQPEYNVPVPVYPYGP